MEAVVHTPQAVMFGQSGNSFQIGDDWVTVPFSGLLVSDCTLHNLDDFGKGFGKELYRKALNQFEVLYTVWPVSDEAMRVRESLIWSGIARQIHFENDYGIVALMKC